MIANEVGLARNTVRRYLRSPTVPVADLRAGRRSLLTPYAEYLQARWTAGCHNATVLWQELQGHGYTGGISILKAYLAPGAQRAEQHRRRGAGQRAKRCGCYVNPQKCEKPQNRPTLNGSAPRAQKLRRRAT